MLEQSPKPSRLNLSEVADAWQYAEWAGADSPPDTVWTAIRRAGTVASVAGELGTWSLDGPKVDFDASAHWFRLALNAELVEQAAGAPWLVFDGLATHCKVWLNNVLILDAQNMFRAYEVDVSPFWQADVNELVFRFEPLHAVLSQKRPRPAWRTPMVAHQQLRWTRTTLLGRLPGWCPPVAPVGIWKPVHLEMRSPGQLLKATLHASVADDMGRVTVRCEFDGDVRAPSGCVVKLQGPNGVHQSQLQATDAPNVMTCVIEVPGPDRWWPHTHGSPVLHEVWMTSPDADNPVLLGRVGFRTLVIDETHGGFSVVVNDVPVFCRGACWMPLNVQKLTASRQATFEAVQQAQAAGMNMLRVPGSTVYEDTAFFDACDALGVLVWHDLMFSNMDYPGSDAAFASEACTEIDQRTQAWSAHPSLAVVCGNSEVEQQAAMWGAPRERWRSDFFDERVRSVVANTLPGTPYWPSSAHGGAFPHQPDTGTSSYYGVGAYKRGLDDAITSKVTFATECLALANIPPASTLKRAPCGEAPQVHSPAWKSRVFRDQMVGWDFDDVRDHYVQTLLHMDPQALRAFDPSRHLELGRAIGAEVLSRTMAVWRSQESSCRGALVWYLRDLWAGAGCGLTDETGTPKSVWHALSRVQQPLLAVLTDHGMNGVALQLVNETPEDVHGTVQLKLYKHGQTRVSEQVQTVSVSARNSGRWNLAQWLQGFVDVNWSHRFGPPTVDLVVATWMNDQGQELSQALYFNPALMVAFNGEPGLTATAMQLNTTSVTVQLQTRGAAFAVHFDVQGWAPDDDHFHMAPDTTRVVTFTGTGHWYACVSALNSRQIKPIPFTSLSSPQSS